MFVFYFRINITNAIMSFYKSMSALTREFLFSKIWLSSTVGDNIVVIKSINEKVWNVNFSKNNGTFAFTEGWSKVVADLCLSEGYILLFKQVNPYNYILTPFFKETPYPLCDPGITLFISISSLPNRKYIESFCHVFNDQSVNTLVNSDPDLRTSTHLVNNVDDVHHDVDMNSDLDPEVAALFEPSDSDEAVVGSSDSDVSIDDDFDDDDVEDSTGDSDDGKKDPDYQPVEFKWDYHPRHFRLNSKVASMARVDISRKMTIQNLAGVDTVVTF
ncbi:putative transcription factor B3-Domain family [Helianthus annuus]|nr:putative transcription factor B3-Domain family [Helianthus annuus]KAJ0957625.1 putative transcription factor B3-Domain family [Helianthus annuus]